MSIAARHAEKLAQLQGLDSQIAELRAHVTPADVLQDPQYIAPETKLDDNLGSLTLYQLHAKHQELEEAGKLLNGLWLVRALVQEIRVALDPLGDDNYVCDAAELHSVLDNLKKLQGKLQRMSELDLVIVPTLRSYYGELVHTGVAKLKLLLHLFIPQADNAFVVNSYVGVNGTDISIAEFNSLYKSYEEFAAVNDISEALTLLKARWEKHILAKLVSKKSYLVLHQEGAKNVLQVTEAPSQFLSRHYFESLKSFVVFVDTLDNQSFRNSFSTAISNSLVEAISENIKTFMENKEQMMEELADTLDLFSRSGWPMPIRNVFTAQDKIQDNLHQLYLNWMTDKYINEVREVFTGAAFAEDIKALETFEEVVEIIPEAPPAKEEIHLPVQDAASEEYDWDADWGSDAEEKKPEEDNWDNWDDDWDDEPAPAKTKPVSKPVVEATPKKESAADWKPLQKETYTFTRSAIPQKLTSILDEFAYESDGSDALLLYDTILSLAIVSYPSVSQLFLLFNDLKGVKCADDYLAQSAHLEWAYYRQGLLNKVTDIITKVDFSNREESPAGIDDATTKGTSRLATVFAELNQSELQSTNSREFKLLVTQLLNLMNHLTLNIIVSSTEITEYQSDKYTSFLENLLELESKALAKVGEDVAKLATYNKVKQAIYLINNHLKDIMDFFYLGELYDFATDELIQVLKSVFIPSELRERCIGEIIEIRNS